jgi:hypothetical protein
VIIPHSWWGPAAVERINAYRASRGRPAVTAQTRPDIDPAPARTPARTSAAPAPPARSVYQASLLREPRGVFQPRQG